MSLIPDMANALHLSVGGHAACNGAALSPDLSLDSPECRDLPVCPACFALAEHQRRGRKPSRLTDREIAAENRAEDAELARLSPSEHEDYCPELDR